MIRMMLVMLAVSEDWTPDEVDAVWEAIKDMPAHDPPSQLLRAIRKAVDPVW